MNEKKTDSPEVKLFDPDSPHDAWIHHEFKKFQEHYLLINMSHIYLDMGFRGLQIGCTYDSRKTEDQTGRIEATHSRLALPLIFATPKLVRVRAPRDPIKDPDGTNEIEFFFNALPNSTWRNRQSFQPVPNQEVNIADIPSSDLPLLIGMSPYKLMYTEEGKPRAYVWK